MVHTIEPWSDQYRTDTIYSVIDLGELAVRLGSIVSFDRRGNVFWMDDFEADNLKWHINKGGANAAVAIDDTFPRNGNGDCKLTAGEGAGGYAMISKYLSLSRLGKMGFEVSFTVDADTDWVMIYIYYYSGSMLYQARIKYDMANTKLQYYNSAGGYTDLVTGVKVVTADECYNTLKLVVDLNNFKYVRLIFNETETDMSALSFGGAASANNGTIILAVRHNSDDAAVKSIYVDDVIITQNEP